MNQKTLFAVNMLQYTQETVLFITVMIILKIGTRRTLMFVKLQFN